MNKWRFLLLFSLILVISCGEIGEEGEEEEGKSVSVVEKQGWHFQGRNCLACHNVDLKPERHLLVAGTMFKQFNVENPDDLSKVCKGEFYLQFVDQNGNVIYDSRDYKDPNSRGYRGQGNVFILMRKLGYISGNYYVRIIDKDGLTIAQSSTLHTFTDINSYDPRTNPTDPSNRFSCNTCHTYPNPKGGAPGRIYPQFNLNLCK